MTRTDPQVNIRLDDKRSAQRRADEDYRGNLTAYINALIKADAAKHPDLSKDLPKGRKKKKP